MKKIRVFLVLIFSLACMLSLTACGGSGGYYVDGSLDVDISYYSWGDASADVSFQVYIPDKGKHEVSYTLTMYYLDVQIKSERFTTSCNSDGNDFVDISEYWSVDYSANIAASSLFEVAISNVKVSKGVSIDGAYVGLAIGFGIVGGLMLAGLIALYIYLNKKNGGKQVA